MSLNIILNIINLGGYGVSLARYSVSIVVAIILEKSFSSLTFWMNN